MKRSEMIIEIVKILYNNGMKVSMMEAYPVAEKILSMQEQAKMLPPLREIEVKAPATTWYYEGHEWDNEDER